MKYSYSTLRWSRRKCANWVKRHRCPECKTKRLLEGPDYDQFKVTCQDCGWRGRVKPPQEALRGSVQ